MPRALDLNKRSSNAAMRMRAYRSLKKVDKQREQDERLRDEVVGSCSYSPQVLPQPAEPVFSEGAVYGGDQSVHATDQSPPNIKSSPAPYPPVEETGLPPSTLSCPVCCSALPTTSDYAILTALQEIRMAQQDLALQMQEMRTAQHEVNNALLTGIEEIKEAQQDLELQFRRSKAAVTHGCEELKQSVNALIFVNQAVGGSTDNYPPLPARTMEQVIDLNSRLSDYTYYSQLSDRFLAVYGRDLRTLVRNILNRLISPVMREEVHCTGRGSPFIFEGSRIYGFVIDQVSRRPAFSAVEPNTVGYEVQLWLRLRRPQKKIRAPMGVS